jgi:hypothetical protein
VKHVGGDPERKYIVLNNKKIQYKKAEFARAPIVHAPIRLPAGRLERVGGEPERGDGRVRARHGGRAILAQRDAAAIIIIIFASLPRERKPREQRGPQRARAPRGLGKAVHRHRQRAHARNRVGRGSVGALYMKSKL